MQFDTEFATNALVRLGHLTTSLNGAIILRRREFHALSKIDSVLVDLGARVSLTDALGREVGSEEELVLRTARLVAIRQLDRIERVMRVAGNQTRADMPGRFMSMIPVARTELQRITHLWLPYREVALHGRFPASMAWVKYKDAVRVATYELSRLDKVPGLDRMLYHGVASIKWPAIATACEQILVATRTRIDFRPARRLWDARRCSGPAGGS